MRRSINPRLLSFVLPLFELFVYNHRAEHQLQIIVEKRTGSVYILYNFIDVNLLIPVLSPIQEMYPLSMPPGF